MNYIRQNCMVRVDGGALPAEADDWRHPEDYRFLWGTPECWPEGSKVGGYLVKRDF
jgi:hypothetical protein